MAAPFFYPRPTAARATLPFRTVSIARRIIRSLQRLRRAPRQPPRVSPPTRHRRIGRDGGLVRGGRLLPALAHINYMACAIASSNALPFEAAALVCGAQKSPSLREGLEGRELRPGRGDFSPGQKMNPSTMIHSTMVMITPAQIVPDMESSGFFMMVCLSC